MKWNTLLFAGAQALAMVNSQMVPTLGALMVVHLLGSASLAGIGTSIIGAARLLVAFPLGALMDAYGRRWGLMLGIAVGLLGSFTAGFSIVWHSFPLFLVGILVFGLGVGSAFQIRLAAADMYPPSRRAEGLGYVLTGSLVGAFGAPLLLGAAERLAPALALDPLAFAWMLLPLTILPTIGLIALVRPDPREIARNLRRYYPGLDLKGETAAGWSDGFKLATFWGDRLRRAAAVASLSSQANMSMMMALASLALAHHGHGLTAISLAVALHAIGMFGFSLPLGRLADRWGRRLVTLSGLVCSAVGSILVSGSDLYWLITAGLFLVGIGWSCVSVASTALIADTTPPLERGRAIGTNDTLSAVGAIAGPLLAGPIVQWLGLSVLGLAAAVVVLAPLPLVARLSGASRAQVSEPAALA